MADEHRNRLVYKQLRNSFATIANRRGVNRWGHYDVVDLRGLYVGRNQTRYLVRSDQGQAAMQIMQIWSGSNLAVPDTVVDVPVPTRR
jgi:hypothetical protein